MHIDTKCITLISSPNSNTNSNVYCKQSSKCLAYIQTKFNKLVIIILTCTSNINPWPHGVLFQGRMIARGSKCKQNAGISHRTYFDPIAV